jgi:hypothetical protein
MNITNSTISGFSNEYNNVTLGEYNKVDYSSLATIKPDGSDIPVAAGITFARANNNAKAEEIDTEYQKLNFNFNVLTFPEGTEEADFVGAVNVKWLDPAGEVYASTSWYPGSKAAKIDISFPNQVLNNGWYDRKYNDWKNADDSIPEEDQFVVLADVENVFEPVANDFVLALDVNVSLQVSEVFGYNLYLNALPDNGDAVVFDGFYVGSDKITNGVFENVTVDGVDGCFRLAGVIGVKELESEEITIKYTVNGVVLQKKVTINVLDYVQQVANTYACGSDECKIVFAMMNYKLESYIELTGVETDDFTLIISDFLMWHSTGCTCLDFDYSANESVADTTAIDDKLVGFDYAMLLDSSNEFASKFTFAVKVKKDSGVTAISGQVAEGDIEFVVSEFNDYVEYRAIIDLENLNKLISLTLTTADGELSASYDLVKHIELYDLDLHKSLYVISAAASENE